MKLRGDPNDPHTLLKAVFHYYCRFGRTGAKGAGEKTLDNANFSKLCRDSPGLLDNAFASTDVDLIFIKAKKKGERRINYARFLDALGMIAIQKYSDLVRVWPLCEDARTVDDELSSRRPLGSLL